ncbi:hypothetical protein ACQKO5_20710 [Novosphingobium subterraneum]|uniref:hypothetical protein n=1 Tax=Novosphingobium subterraneum TaxID=48936 RepID=UPI003CFE702C
MDLGTCNQGGKLLFGRLAAGPGLAIALACLSKFGRIDSEQADLLACDNKGIAICCRCTARYNLSVCRKGQGCNQGEGSDPVAHHHSFAGSNRITSLEFKKLRFGDRAEAGPHLPILQRSGLARQER